MPLDKLAAFKTFGNPTKNNKVSIQAALSDAEKMIRKQRLHARKAL